MIRQPSAPARTMIKLPHATARPRPRCSVNTPTFRPPSASASTTTVSRTRLLWLSLGAFTIGTQTFMFAGLLPRIATDLGVSVSLAGQLVTIYALAYALGSPLIAVATGNLERKRLLLAALAAFAAGNILAAFARNYTTLLAAQVFLALAAGTFMPAASAFAVSVSSTERRGKALALIFSGVTFATVIGVPASVLVGEQLGWRSTFVVVALLSVLATTGIGFALPRARSTSPVSLRERLVIARRPDVLVVLIQTLLALAGTFAVYTYLAPLLERTAGLTGHVLVAVLFLFGVGGATGNLVGGHLTDRFGPLPVLRTALGGLVVLFVTLALAATLLAPHAAWMLVPVIAAWGLLGWSFPIAQQARLVGLEPRLAPITVSLNASAVYLGVALGAVTGAVVVGHASIADLGWAAAGSVTLALGLLLPATARRRPSADATTRLRQSERDQSRSQLEAPARPRRVRSRRFASLLVSLPVRQQEDDR